jgi:hypothetical protein
MIGKEVEENSRKFLNFYLPASTGHIDIITAELPAASLNI